MRDVFKLCGIMSQILHEGGSERLAEDGESGGGQASLARDGGGHLEGKEIIRALMPCHLVKCCRKPA